MKQKPRILLAGVAEIVGHLCASVLNLVARVEKLEGQREKAVLTKVKVVGRKRKK